MPIVIQQEDNFLQSYHLESDGNILMIPFYRIRKKFMVDNFLSKCLKSWRLYQVDWDFSYGAGIFVKGKLPALLAKVFLFFNHKIYWQILIHKMLWRLHLIKISDDEEFSWRKNFKPIILFKNSFGKLN